MGSTHAGVLPTLCSQIVFACARLSDTDLVLLGGSGAYRASHGGSACQVRACVPPDPYLTGLWVCHCGKDGAGRASWTMCARVQRAGAREVDGCRSDNKTDTYS